MVRRAADVWFHYGVANGKGELEGRQEKKGRRQNTSAPIYMYGKPR